MPATTTLTLTPSLISLSLGLYPGYLSPPENNCYSRVLRKFTTSFTPFVRNREQEPGLALCADGCPINNINPHGRREAVCATLSLTLGYSLREASFCASFSLFFLTFCSFLTTFNHLFLAFLPKPALNQGVYIQWCTPREACLRGINLGITS